MVDVANPAATASITNFEVVNASAARFKVTLPTSVEAGTELTSKVTVLDPYGNTVRNYFGTVHFVSSDMNALLPIDYMFDNVDSGVHDFPITLRTSGVQTLTVVDQASSTVLGSESVTVSSSTAAIFAVEFPSNVVAGEAATLTVRALDAYGNVATGYRGTVRFGSSDSQAGLPASYSFANKDLGVATFTVTLKTAGTHSLTVDDSSGAVSMTRTGISVVPSSTAGSFVVQGFRIPLPV